MSTVIRKDGKYWVVGRRYAIGRQNMRTRGSTRVLMGDKEALKTEVMRQCVAAREAVDAGASS